MQNLKVRPLGIHDNGNKLEYQIRGIKEFPHKSASSTMARNCHF
jgi:hypothetical protein